MASLWGDWLPKMIAEMDATEPTPDEKEIQRQAAQIKEAHQKRLKIITDRYSSYVKPEET